MIKNNIRVAFVSLFVLLAGCVPPDTGPQLTPLEIQSLQTREYEHPKDVVFPSVVSVFQDLGYTIKSADITSGLVTADSATKGGTNFIPFVGITNTTNQTAVTAFIETIGKITRVRINIVERRGSSSAYGQNTANDTPILDAAIYQNAFERIESAIFIRSSN